MNHNFNKYFFKLKNNLKILSYTHKFMNINRFSTNKINN